MSNERDMKGRLSKLTDEQRRLLEIRLRERGLNEERAKGGENAKPGGGHGSGEPNPEDDPDPDAWRRRRPARPVRFSLYFFSDDGSREAEEKYRLVLESARFADAHGFDAVWTPERHFQPFGGLYPNPSVLGAALAAITTRVGIRAGSVALPLHNPIRVAEEWSVVDNLSNGRVAVSFASGWHPDDFVLFPTPYAERKETMFRGIETIRRLWAGETLVLEGPPSQEGRPAEGEQPAQDRSASGGHRANESPRTVLDPDQAAESVNQGSRPVEVRLLPRPIQRELPIWVTTAGSPETWERAGAIGANVLAALVAYGPEDLAAMVARYRRARAAAGHDPAAGIVTLVAHTYVGTDNAAVREQVREPMTHYLRSYLGQFKNLGLAEAGGGERDALDVARLAFEHYFDSATLLGTPNKCARVLDALAAAGADEVACLVDFGLDTDTVLEALPRLAALSEHHADAGHQKPMESDRAAGEGGSTSIAGITRQQRVEADRAETKTAQQHVESNRSAAADRGTVVATQEGPNAVRSEGTRLVLGGAAADAAARTAERE